MSIVRSHSIDESALPQVQKNVLKRHVRMRYHFMVLPVSATLCGHCASAGERLCAAAPKKAARFPAEGRRKDNGKAPTEMKIPAESRRMS